MALTELEIKRCERDLARFMESRRPPHMRHQLDLGFRISGQKVEIFRILPRWNNPSEKVEEPVVKATFVRTENFWRVYWMQQDLKWHAYPPQPEVQSLEAFLEVVNWDENSCFFG